MVEVRLSVISAFLWHHEKWPARSSLKILSARLLSRMPMARCLSCAAKGRLTCTRGDVDSSPRRGTAALRMGREPLWRASGPREQVDPVTLYCLVSTAEAFLSAGMTPEQLDAHLHPGRVGVTIGTGIGGMSKLKRLYRDFYDGAERQNDTLQETLINVIGGYVVQSFLGC